LLPSIVFKPLNIETEIFSPKVNFLMGFKISVFLSSERINLKLFKPLFDPLILKSDELIL
jgi:hypothetical protein